MPFEPKALREFTVLVLDVARRRALLFCVPVGIALLLGVIAVKLAPIKYEASSLILLQSANRAGNSNFGVPHSAVTEQIAAVEAWLKSDQVLIGLLPELMDGKTPQNAAEQYSMLTVLRKSLTLELIGSSVLEVRLEGRDPKGLAKRLEAIVSRLMEGLIGPEQDILNASQFVVLRSKEEEATAEMALNRAIAAADLGAPDAVEAQLKRLSDVTQRLDRLRSGAASKSTAQASDAYDQLAAAADSLRRSISADPNVAASLERLYADYQSASTRYDGHKQLTTARASNYVGIFDSPQNLLIIGRPQDPLYGVNGARKFAIAGIFLSAVGAMALVLLLEILQGRLRTRREFEELSGLPVVARIGKL